MFSIDLDNNLFLIQNQFADPSFNQTILQAFGLTRDEFILYKQNDSLFFQMITLSPTTIPTTATVSESTRDSRRTAQAYLY